MLMWSILKSKKKMDTWKIALFNINGTVSFYMYHAIMSQKDADELANIAKPDSDAVLSGSTLLAQTCLSKYKGLLG